MFTCPSPSRGTFQLPLALFCHQLCHDEHPCTYSIWKNYVEVYARDRLTKSQIIPIYNFAKYFQISFQYHYTNSPAL